MTPSYRFFLGYSRCNYPFAECLKADLAWAGIDIFCDNTDWRSPVPLGNFVGSVTRSVASMDAVVKTSFYPRGAILQRE